MQILYTNASTSKVSQISLFKSIISQMLDELYINLIILEMNELLSSNIGCNIQGIKIDN